MQRLFLSLLTLLTVLAVGAQNVTVKWELGDATSAITGDGASLVSASYAMGASLTNSGTMTSSGADTGYSAVTYDPAFTKYTPSAQVSTKTSGHQVAFQVTPADGHLFKPTKISFDAAKVGTNNGGVIVCTKLSGGTETQVAEETPLRNKIDATNSTGSAIMSTL